MSKLTTLEKASACVGLADKGMIVGDALTCVEFARYIMERHNPDKCIMCRSAPRLAGSDLCGGCTADGYWIE